MKIIAFIKSKNDSSKKYREQAAKIYNYAAYNFYGETVDYHHSKKFEDDFEFLQNLTISKPDILLVTSIKKLSKEYHKNYQLLFSRIGTKIIAVDQK